MKIFTLANILTGEIYGKCYTETLAAAQEYFSVIYPNTVGKYIMLFEGVI